MYVSTAVWKVAPAISGTPFTTIDGAVNAYHVSFTMGTPPAQRKFIKYPGTDGGIDQGFNLGARKAVWELFVKADTEAEFDAKREAIYELFKPYDQPILINVDMAGFGPVRQLDAFVDGAVDFRQSQQVGYSTIVRVPLYCPEPLWYAPSRVSALSTIPTSGAGFSFNYLGNHEEWPVVELVGQLVNPTLSITTTTAYRTETAKIDLTGVTIPDGTTYTIDLRPGRKTVATNTGVNKIHEMVDQSWVNMKLWPAPYKASGANVFTYTYTSKNANARVWVRFYERYLSY